MISADFVLIKPTAKWIELAEIVPYSARYLIIQDGDPPFIMTTLPCGRSFVEVLDMTPGVH